ncbi:MAG TPA: hypothetical protein V6C58_13000 [Allocoleopsis sp.]
MIEMESEKISQLINKINDLGITYAVVGPGHIDHIKTLEILRSRSVELVIVSPNQKAIEIYRSNNSDKKSQVNSTGLLEEVLKDYKKSDFHDQLVQSIQMVNDHLASINAEEIYIKEINSTKYYPIPRSDIIKSQTHIPKKKEHQYRRR